MTSLVIGASGQVGSHLHEQLSRRGDCAGTFCHHARPGLRRLDLCDHAAVRDLVREVRPEVCFLPGALTAVDHAETHREECVAVNVLGAAHLALALAGVRGKLVLFSTDHVFPGGPRAWREQDGADPQNVYARSKYLAEKLVRTALPEAHLIVRTSWVFGPDPQGKNFLCRARRTLAGGGTLQVPADQFGQPTYSPDLARATLDLVARGARGTFHVVGPEYLSRLAWSRIIAETLGLDADRVEGLPTSSFPAGAPRPLQSRLDRGKLLAFLGSDPIRPPRNGVIDFAYREKADFAPGERKAG